MKKVAIGCAVLAGLLMLAAAAGGYWFWSVAKQHLAGYAELAEIPALNEKVRNQRTFDPPADLRMTTTQVDRYVAVQYAMRAQLGPRVRELDARYAQLSRELERKGRDANLREVMAVWGDVVSLIVDAKRAQVDALNAAGLSLSEYHWIREQTLVALGHGVFAWNLDALAIDPVGLASIPFTPPTLNPEAATHNRELLRRHEEALDDWLALTFFGL